MSVPAVLDLAEATVGQILATSELGPLEFSDPDGNSLALMSETPRVE